MYMKLGVWRIGRYGGIILLKMLIFFFSKNIFPLPRGIFSEQHEISLSYKTKFNYSWIEKGRSNQLLNMWYKGSKTMIMAISTMGEWIVSPLTTKNNSEDFGDFLKKLLLWVKFDLEKELSD